MQVPRTAGKRAADRSTGPGVGGGESARRPVHQGRQLHRPDGGSARSSPTTAAIKGFKATKPAKAARRSTRTAPRSCATSATCDGKHDAALEGRRRRTKLYDYVYTYNGFAAELTAAQADKLAADTACVAVSPDEIRERRHLVHADVPRPRRSGRPVGPARRRRQRRRRHHHRRSSTPASGRRASASRDRTGVNGNATQGRQARLPADPRLARQVHARRGVQRLDVQPEADRRPVVQRGLGRRRRHRRQRPVGVQLRPRLQRPRHPHRLHRRRQPRRPGDRPGRRLRRDQRHGAARPHRHVQGALVDQDAATAQRLQRPTSSRRSTRPSPTAWTSSTTRSAARSTNFRDPVEISFLFAADAGIFVAESAGNSGPTTSTVAHPGPWTTTVAAGTHNRDGQGSVTLGNGVTYTGASVATAVGPAPLIDSTAAGLPGADPTRGRAVLRRASTTAAPPSSTRRRWPARSSSATAASTPASTRASPSSEAGGVGMILVNTSANSLNADFHFVPTVHLPEHRLARPSRPTRRPRVRRRRSTRRPSSTTPPAPFTASLLVARPAPRRRRRPAQAGPDRPRPGHPRRRRASGQRPACDFNLYSGTSMSSPHVAGLAALLKDLHPGLVADDDQVGADDERPTTSSTGRTRTRCVIFRQGAGHVQPTARPIRASCSTPAGTTGSASCAARSRRVSPAPARRSRHPGYSIDPSDFNGASIAIGDLAGSQTVTRTVTNVGAQRHLHVVRHRPGRHHARRHAGVVHAQPGRRRRRSPSRSPAPPPR